MSLATITPRTRRVEEILQAARQLSYTENYSFTEGWNDNTAVTILNLARDKIYGMVTQTSNPANITEFKWDAIAGQQAYDIPIDVQMSMYIIDVRYQYGSQAYEFVTLMESDIQDRFSYPTNIPMVYCIRNNQILLSPTPNITFPQAIIINYQQRMRTLDVRRGKVISFSTSPSVSFQLDFTFTSPKDANLQQNANSVLGFVDYCCIVDRKGLPIVDAIPLENYDINTQLLIADPLYVMPAVDQANLTAFLATGATAYVVQGQFASSNSLLDSLCEDALIEITCSRFLSLQSDAAGREEYMAREEQVLDRLRNQYKRYRPSCYPVRWVGSKGHSTWPFGSKGMV